MKKIIPKKKLLNKSEKLFILIGVLGLLPFIIGFLDLYINKSNLFFVVNLPKYYGSIILTFLKESLCTSFLITELGFSIPSPNQFIPAFLSFSKYWGLQVSILE